MLGSESRVACCTRRGWGLGSHILLSLRVAVQPQLYMVRMTDVPVYYNDKFDLSKLDFPFSFRSLFPLQFIIASASLLLSLIDPCFLCRIMDHECCV